METGNANDLKTDTLDITGKVLETKSFNITREEIEKVLKNFIGNYEMEVPISHRAGIEVPQEKWCMGNYEQT